MSAENVEIVRQALAHFQRTRQYGNLLAPDARLVNAPGSPFTVAATGPEGMREWLENVDEFDEFKIEPVELIDAGEDKVIAVLRNSGRAKLSGVETDVTYTVVYTIRDGKIARGREYMTRAEPSKPPG